MAGGGAGGAGLPAGPFGTLTLNAPGRTPFSYRFTAEDALWTAKLVTLEAGGRADSASAAVVWAMFNRYALVRHTLYPTFHSFIRAYSTTLQPVLLNWRAAQRHLDSPEFVPSGGTYTTKGAPPGIPKGQLRRHLDFQARPWARIGGPARSLTLDALRGSLQNPGIGLSSEFVSTQDPLDAGEQDQARADRPGMAQLHGELPCTRAEAVRLDRRRTRPRPAEERLLPVPVGCRPPGRGRDGDALDLARARHCGGGIGSTPRPQSRPKMNHFFVTVDGDNDNDGTALDDAFRDIVHALGRLEDGDTLSIGDGVYHEQVVIERKNRILIQSVPGRGRQSSTPASRLQ